jgi:hypothetical protein
MCAGAGIAGPADGGEEEVTNPVARLWRAEQLPLWDGLYRMDGRAHAVRLEVLAVGEPFDPVVRESAVSPVAVARRVELPAGSLVCGKAGESGGFFGRCDRDGEVVWVAVLAGAGPFQLVSVEGSAARFGNGSGLSVPVELDDPDFAVPVRRSGGSDSEVAALWRNGLLPGADGLYYVDGGARTLRLGVVEVGADFDVAARLAAEPDSVTSLCIMFRAELSDGSLVGGECAWGSEGFFARLNENRELVWVAYFEDSNPFVGVAVAGSSATFTTNLGLPVTVDLDSAAFGVA